MRVHPIRLRDLLILVASVTLFVAGSYLAFAGIVAHQNRKHVEELNAQALRRSEMAIDYAFTALSELVENGITGCEEAMLAELRHQVHQHSTVKDIRIVDASGRVVCSAFPENSLPATDPSWEVREVARNSQVQLFSLNQTAGPAFGVAWQMLPDVALVAVVGADALLYDILPAQLREQGEVKVSLTSGREIAHYSTEGAASSGSRLGFTTHSDRYPILSSISVSAELFRDWNTELRPAALAIGLGLGIVSAFFVRILLNRPADPVAEIDRALDRAEFRPYLQPIFSLKTREIVGCEILARWDRKDGGLVLPYHFIPVAERSGRIVRLTYQILGEALDQLRPWMKQNRTFKVAVNIGATHLLSRGFVDEFRRVVTDGRVSLRQIVIEVTERDPIQDLKQAADVVGELRTLGFKIAIDDAGTGHSGLSYIQTLGATIIKIDKFFVDSIGRDPAAKAIIGMLVRLAAELNMTTVAEGIETEEQAHLLQACGVAEGQGYLVSPPLPTNAFLALLEESTSKTAQQAELPPLVLSGVA
ncbi:MAG: EAL domain-containing protein, partial [Rhizobium sp.]|nr:EAL domain-containing protein [Rhizobium sp.]